MSFGLLGEARARVLAMRGVLLERGKMKVVHVSGVRVDAIDPASSGRLARLVVALIVLAILLLAVVPARAALIAPGVSALASGEPNPVGGAVLATITSPFANPFYVGSVTTQVIGGDTSNPFGGLTFTYQVLVSPVSTGGIERINGLDYTGFLTDVSYLPGSGTAAPPPTTVDRGATGAQVGFNFVPPPLGAGTLPPSSISPLLVVQTNAFAFAPSVVNIIDGTVTAVPSFGPAIPEPATLGLISLASLALARQRRSR